MRRPGQQSDKTLVVGLGRTGLSCVRYLSARGVPLAVADSRVQPPGLAELRERYADLPLFLGPFQPEVFSTPGRLVVSPGVPLNEPCIHLAQQQGAEVIGDIELFARAAQAPLVAITGSNGKSTVTTLLGEMARQAGRRVAVGGNLGEPALDLLDEAVELYVLELSSFQLETTRSLRTAAAVVLNLSPDHMDRYPDEAAYAAAKGVIYQGAQTQVVNRDDPRALALARAEGARLGFGLGVPVGEDFGLRVRQGEEWLCQGERPLLAARQLRIPGRHNLANALAALALGNAVGLPETAMLQALRGFAGLPHRTQWVAERQGMQWYNDSKGTNVGATQAALEGLHSSGESGRTLLIAGGECKGADFAPLAPVVEQTTRAVILIGRDAPRLEAALVGHTRLAHARTLHEAVALALELGRPGDRVLLSPACASFDMFENFAARGQAFIQAVETLTA